jgi:hypothetical protein
MAQVSLKAGLMKEMRQMHDFEAFFPRDPKTING